MENKFDQMMEKLSSASQRLYLFLKVNLHISEVDQFNLVKAKNYIKLWIIDILDVSTVH